MLQRVKEVQESDLRMNGALARNIQRVLAVTQAQIDAAAANGQYWFVKPVVKVNDPLDNLRGGTQLVIKQNSIQPGQNVMRVIYQGGSAVVVGPGTSPLSLPDATDNEILSLTAFGGTMQGVPNGYTLLDGITGDGNAYIYLGVTLDQDDEIEIDFTMPSTAVSSRSIFGYRYGASSNNIAVMVGGTGSLVCDWNNSDYATYRFTATPTAGARYKAVLNKTGRYLYDTDGNVVASNITACPDTISTSNVCLFYLGGNPAYTGSNSKFNGTIHSVKVAGKCNLVPCKDASNEVGMYDTLNSIFYTAVVESGTFTAGNEVSPIPSAPVDIWCNNGVLKYSRNKVNVIADNVVVGKYISAQGVLSDSEYNFTYMPYVPVKPNTTYTLSFSSPVYFSSVSEYSSAEDAGFVVRQTKYSTSTDAPFDLTVFTFTTGATTNYVRFGSNMYKNVSLTIDDVLALNYMLAESATAVPYAPYVSDNGGIYTDGPIETIAIKDDQNATVSTATCENLLSIGNYTDEQEVISGAVKRKVGVKVLDGTENWSQTDSYSNPWVFYTTFVDGKSGSGTLEKVWSTHFKGVAETNPNMPAESAKITVQGTTPTISRFYVKTTAASTVELWKTWLAAQYAAGTPVIVVYPLETPTTETVTGQAMETAAGDNTAEITQAGMAGLELEVEYIKE